MKSGNFFICAMCLIVVSTQAAFGGGGGERMLLVVNPNDENSIRIANAYQQARAIPDNNILFLAPQASYGFGNIYISSQSDLINHYLTPIAQALAARGLTDQVDYIGTLGQPLRYACKPAIPPADYANSLTYGISLLSPLTQGLPVDNGAFTMTGLFKEPTNIPIGSNTAIHHSQTYSVTYRNETTPRATQYYMGGAIGYTGAQGNTPDQVINGLRRAVSGDGTKPAGTVYFEENDDVRSDTREYQWSHTQTQLTARGVNWLQERLVSGATPKNRTNVRGAVVGMYTLTLPNGSTYLPGSWADNLTSYGAYWENTNQTKITEFIAAGAAATCGSVVEPYAIASRFTNSSVHTFVADGSTLGEAFFKSVATPDIQLLLGDILAQPYADVPATQITSGPDSGAIISGTVAINAKGSLVGPKIATDVSRLDLFVDGKPKGSLTGNNGTFNLDTTSLSDGTHELRVVAVNNAQAESEGYTLRNFVVNNHNRSVTADDSTLHIAARQILPVAVCASAGDGTVSRIELRSLGRTLGQVSGSSGNVSLDASMLAYGDNRIVPVAVYSDGSEVAGETLTMNRQPNWMTGHTPSPTNLRTAGFKGEFFAGQGQSSIAASTFDGNPTAVVNYSKLIIVSGLKDSGGTYYSHLRSPGFTYPPLTMPAVSIDHLSARFTASFEIAPGKEGEYQFFFFESNDSTQLKIDGEPIQGYDNAKDGYVPLFGGDVFLKQGEHDMEVLAANLVTADAWANYFDVGLLYRGPDGITRVADSSFFYQAPEPSSCMLLALATLAVLRRRARQAPGTDA